MSYDTSGCSSQGFSWSPSNRYLNRSKLASTRLCNNHIICDSVGFRVLRPGIKWWPSWADCYNNIKLVPQIACPVLVIHVRCLLNLPMYKIYMFASETNICVSRSLALLSDTLGETWKSCVQADLPLFRLEIRSRDLTDHSRQGRCIPTPSPHRVSITLRNNHPMCVM